MQVTPVAEPDPTPAPKPATNYAGPTIDPGTVPESAADMVGELMRHFGVEEPAELIQLAVKNVEARATMIDAICDSDPESLAESRMNPLSVIISYVNTTNPSV